jgi:hypothetical protein
MLVSFLPVFVLGSNTVENVDSQSENLLVELLGTPHLLHSLGKLLIGQNSTPLYTGSNEKVDILRHILGLRLRAENDPSNSAIQYLIDHPASDVSPAYKYSLFDSKLVLKNSRFSRQESFDLNHLSSTLFASPEKLMLLGPDKQLEISLISSRHTDALRQLKSLEFFISAQYVNGCGMLNFIDQIDDYNITSDCLFELTEETLHKISSIQIHEVTSAVLDHLYNLKSSPVALIFPTVEIYEYALNTVDYQQVAFLADKISYMNVLNFPGPFGPVEFRNVNWLKFDGETVVDLSNIQIRELTYVSIEEDERSSEFFTIPWYESWRTFHAPFYNLILTKVEIGTIRIPDNLRYQKLTIEECGNLNVFNPITVRELEIKDTSILDLRVFTVTEKISLESVTGYGTILMDNEKVSIEYFEDNLLEMVTFSSQVRHVDFGQNFIESLEPIMRLPRQIKKVSFKMHAKSVVNINELRRFETIEVYSPSNEILNLEKRRFSKVIESRQISGSNRTVAIFKRRNLKRKNSDI